MIYIFLTGGPCAGKTTIANILCDATGIDRISSGDMARFLAERDPEVASELAAGRLAPEHIMNVEMLSRLLNYRVGVVVVDGYPRYFEQLLDIERFLKGDKFYFDVQLNEHDIRNRCQVRARDDDFGEAFENRLRTFKERTTPMVKWLYDRRLAVMLNGNFTDRFAVERALIDHINIKRGYAPGLRGIVL